MKAASVEQRTGVELAPTATPFFRTQVGTLPPTNLLLVFVEFRKNQPNLNSLERTAATPLPVYAGLAPRYSSETSSSESEQAVRAKFGEEHLVPEQYYYTAAEQPVS